MKATAKKSSSTTNNNGQSKVRIFDTTLRDGEQTPGELATIQHVQPQSLTRVIAALAKAGPVARRVSLRPSI